MSRPSNSSEPGGDVGQAHQASAESGFTATGLPDGAKRFPGPDIERYRVDRLDRPALRREDRAADVIVFGKVAGPEQRALPQHAAHTGVSMLATSRIWNRLRLVSGNAQAARWPFPPTSGGWTTQASWRNAQRGPKAQPFGGWKGKAEFPESRRAVPDIVQRNNADVSPTRQFAVLDRLETGSRNSIAKAPHFAVWQNRIAPTACDGGAFLASSNPGVVPSWRGCLVLSAVVISLQFWHGQPRR